VQQWPIPPSQRLPKDRQGCEGPDKSRRGLAAADPRSRVVKVINSFMFNEIVVRIKYAEEMLIQFAKGMLPVFLKIR
jgi:hypothetical protein